MGKRQGVRWQGLKGDLSPPGFLVVASGHERGSAGGVGAAALPDNPFGDWNLWSNLFHIATDLRVADPEGAADGAVAPGQGGMGTGRPFDPPPRRFRLGDAARPGRLLSAASCARTDRAGP